MNLLCFPVMINLLLIVFLYSGLSDTSFASSSDQEALKKAEPLDPLVGRCPLSEAEKLYKQAVEKREKGLYKESIFLSKRALEIYKTGCKNEQWVSGISNISKILESWERGFPSKLAAGNYLGYLEYYLRKESLEKCIKKEKVPVPNKYQVRKRKSSAGKSNSAPKSEQEKKRLMTKAKKLYEQATILNEQGKYDEAIHLSQQAIEIYKIFHKLRRGTDRSGIAQFYEKTKGDKAAAASIYLACLNMAQAEFQALAEYKRYKADYKKYRSKKRDRLRKDLIQKLLQGKLDEGSYKKELKQYLDKIETEDLPMLRALEWLKRSSFTNFGYEFIVPSIDHSDMFNQFLSIMSSDKMVIDTIVDYIPEKEKIHFIAAKINNLNAFLSFVVTHPPQKPKDRKTAFNIWINRKGMLLEAQREFQKALVDSGNPEVEEVFEELKKIRLEMSYIFFSKVQNSETFERQIAKLEKEKERLEDELRRLSQSYDLKKHIDTADSQTIAKCLPAGSVLLDFAKVKMRDFQARKWLPAHYIVFVLNAGVGNRLSMIDLGDAEKIDSTIRHFKRQLKNDADIFYGGTRLKKSARRLYSRIFFPVIHLLDRAKEIYISPDGNLNLIPFEVLLSSEGKYLIEDYTFNYLAASRDILGFGMIDKKGGRSMVFGNPDFNLAFPKISGNKDPIVASSNRSHSMDSLSFSHLPHTETEVINIQKILGKDKADLYKGRDALESELFSHDAPEILHLATHGFFLKDQEPPTIVKSNGIAIGNSASMSKVETNAFWENPLLRSGLALAGANTSLKGGSRENRGIVTAEKILGLRLRGTRMVVLSACETGLGKIQSGEGVFGLRRAFVQAGTRSLVMSMWSVPDRETQELMVQFYKNIAAGMRRNKALRQAALKQMRILTNRYGYAHPLYWGAFVFLGES